MSWLTGLKELAQADLWPRVIEANLQTTEAAQDHFGTSAPGHITAPYTGGKYGHQYDATELFDEDFSDGCIQEILEKG